MIHPYWNLDQGAWIEYAFMSIKGNYNPSTMGIAITEQKIIPNLWTPGKGTRFRMYNMVNLNALIPHTARVDIDPTETITPSTDWSQRSLCNGVFKDGVSFIGEVGSPGFTANKPPPVLTMNPIAGEVLYVPVSWRLWATGQEGTYNTKYTTCAVGVPWGAFPNVIRTCLEERYDLPGQNGNWVYNYSYQLGVGPADIYWGARKPDNSIEGYQMYMEAHS